MICRQVEDLVDELVDGSLDAERERVLRGHLRGCAGCAALVATTERMVKAAGSLEKLDVPSHLWGAISKQLDEDDRKAEERPAWWWRWRASRGAWLGFAGAAIAAAAVAVLAFVPGRQNLIAPAAPELRAQRWADAASRLDQAEADYALALSQLAAVVEEDRPHWAEATRTDFDETRAAIDAVLERQRAIAHQNPEDAEAQEALFLAYRRKVELYQELAVRGGL